MLKSHTDIDRLDTQPNFNVHNSSLDFFWCVFISFVLVSLHLLSSPQKKSHAVYLSNTLFRIVRFQSIEIENFVEILFGQIHRTLFYLRHDCRITHREKERGKKPQYLFMKTIFTMQINTENRS